jgi:two-component system, LytTR family, sensor kinase
MGRETVTLRIVRPGSITWEAAKIAVLYLILSGVFYASVAYFIGSMAGPRFGGGSIGQSELIELSALIFSISTMSLLVSLWRSKNMSLNLVYCFIISSGISVLDFLTAREAYRFFYPDAGHDFSFQGNAEALFMCMATYFGWSCLFLTLLYSFDVRDRERRLAAVREEALSAQMRALRYQVNPHFLFNTLNSIAGLIEEGSATRAERMVLSLSTFLRTTLTLDPLHDVPLAEELALQEEYLEIEHQRFSDRMTFDIDIPEDVSGALVPSLILQPLIENAVKHGVGQLTGKARISLFARREADRLKLSVENDMPVQTMTHSLKGIGIGLKNVAERLSARFADDGHFTAGPAGAGLYRATLDIPWKTR